MTSMVPQNVKHRGRSNGRHRSTQRREAPLSISKSAFFVGPLARLRGALADCGPGVPAPLNAAYQTSVRLSPAYPRPAAPKNNPRLLDAVCTSEIFVAHHLCSIIICSASKALLINSAHTPSMSDPRLPHVNAPIKKARPALKRRSTTKAALSQSASPTPATADMATSFLQFCASCERQITTPCNSILYCSEACRDKDSKKPMSMAITGVSPVSSPPASPRPVLSPRTPSTPHVYNTPSIRIPADLHNAKSDLDPTEWKPKLHSRADSEAYRYLSQYHRSATAIAELNEKRERPTFFHSNTTGMTTSTSTPSLSLASTPTQASSWGTGGYDFNTRPLQARHNPIYSASAGMTKGIDLVTPHVPPPAETAIHMVVDADDVWGKKIIVRGNASGQGLAALFGEVTPK